MDIAIITNLAEQHNSMGQFVQQKLHELRTGKPVTLDDVSRGRILDWLNECKGTEGVTGVDELIALVEAAPSD